MCSLGQRLVICREKHRLRQQDVADKLGLTNTQLSNYERNYREPNIETLIKLADFYGVSIEWLTTGVEVDIGKALERHGVRFYGMEIPEKVRLSVLEFIRTKMHNF
jgi:transcriptional regulator with XRE-family HTH domain